MFASVCIFSLATIAFGLSTSLWPAVFSLVVLGAADMVSVYVRASLIQLHTPDAMRGRVSAVSLIFISASNELGEFRAGTLAAAIGAVQATVLGGVLALAVTIAWALLFPALRKAETLDVPESLKH
jgi:MFS family permease